MRKSLLLPILLLLSGCQTVNMSCLTNTGETGKVSSTMRDTDTQSPTTNVSGTIPLR